MCCKSKFAVCIGVIFVGIALIYTAIFSLQSRYTGIDEEILSTSDTMLVRYHWTTVGSVEVGRYEEFVLSTTGDPEQLRLDYVEGSEASNPVCITVSVSADAAQLCYQSIAKAGMQKWNGMKNSIAVCGVGISCTFRNGNEYVCVSTDAMPKDGERKLNQIRQILMSYLAEETETFER